MERYDYYLAASVVSECPMTRSFSAFSLIGMDLDDGSLYPEKDEGFLAVVDFPQKGFEKERAIQIQALRETDTRYVALEKEMSSEEIRKIYRRTCIFFLSFRESFGLPIVELQLCGSYIGTPYKNWAPSHYINKNIYERGEGDLSGNFIVYNNDANTLKNEIVRVKSDYNPDTVLQEFGKCHPHLHHGDLEELKRFLHLIESGSVTGLSHRHYARINNEIVTGA